jgi:hypothetical protein
MRKSWMHVARIWGEKNAYKFLVMKPEGRRTLERPIRIWEVITSKKDFKEIERKYVKRIHLAQLRHQWPAVVKSNPCKTWTGPEVSRRSRLPDFNKIGT